MSFLRREVPRTKQLVDYMEEEVTGSERRQIELDLASSREAQTRLSELRRIADSLAAPVPELDSVDMTDRVCGSIGAHTAAPMPVLPLRFFSSALLGAVAFACIALFVDHTLRRDEFRSKGAQSSANEDQKWTGIQLYKLSPDRPKHPEPLVRDISAHDGWLFSYTNLGAKPFEYLMVVAVDASGTIRWFHPAYEHIGEDPTSITLASNQREKLLPGVTTHDLAIGPITLYAIFTHTPLRVSEVEAWLPQRKSLDEAPLRTTAHLQRFERVVQP